MADKINSAYRVLDILKKAKPHSDKQKVFEVWASVFEVEGGDQNKTNFEISVCLNQMHEEVESIRQAMSKTEFDESLYDSSLNKINNVLAVHALMGTWQGLKGTLDGEVFMCLGYCQEILPDEEDLIDDVDIGEIQEILESLKSQMSESSLPEYTKRIIQDHIENIRSALHSYRIIGAKSLQNALKTAVGEVVANDDIFSQAKDTKEVGDVGKLLKKLHEVTDKVVKSEKVVSSATKLAEHGTKALEIIDKLIQ